jgi:hypothetical protein
VLEALIVSNENPPPSTYGIEIGDVSAYESPAGTVKLKVDIIVHDPEKLREFARQRYSECWQDAEWRPEHPAQAALEALVNSNANPSPSDYGIALGESEATQLGELSDDA